MHRGREVAENCDVANHREKGEKWHAWGSGSGVVGPGRRSPAHTGSPVETGLTGDRRSGVATSEERGDKKHGVRKHGLPAVPGVGNLERKNELLGSRVEEP